MKVLIIKLTSMGDLMHALPALTDAANAYPDIEFDWVVDQAFSEVPLWHPHVNQVIKTAHRQWRKTPFKFIFGGGLKAFKAQLNLADYDAIVDLQGNLKSAVVAKLCKGDVSGFDAESCREKPAYWAYQHQYPVSKNQHSIERMRALMAQALIYDLPIQPAEYGVDLSQYDLPKLDFSFPEKYLFFVHNASWLTKMWPISSWQSLVTKAAVQGYSVLLPCGNDVEYQRAQEIASVSPHAFALPKLSLNYIAALMYQASGAVCSDTGLAHLAGVAGIPAVTLYGATDPILIGTYGENQYHIISDLLSQSLENAKKGPAIGMENMGAEQVWDRLESILPAQ